MQYVVIVILGEIHAAYGPFQTVQAAKQWINTARDKHIIGTAMETVVSRVYSIEDLN